MIQGENSVQFKSGGNTELDGARIEGEKVIGDVGGKLIISSQQDRESYENSQKSTGASIGISNTGVTGSFNQNTLRANSEYQAVQEQSGIFAGDEGFDISVEGETNLKGGAIVSTAEEQKNSLSTETLAFSNIENQADFDVKTKSVGINLGKGGPSGISGGAAKKSGSATNTTYSALSNGTIDVRSDPDFERAGDLKSSSQEAHQTLDRIFDQSIIKDVQDNAKVMQMLGEEGSRVIGDLYKKIDEAEALEAAARQAVQDGVEGAEALLKAAIANTQKVKDASGLPDKAVAHALLGGLSVAAGGGSFAQGALAAGLPEALQEDLAALSGDNDAMQNLLSTIIGGAVSGTQGALAAGNADKFNRQLHPTEIDLINKHASAFAKQQGISEEEAIGILTLEVLRNVDTEFENVTSNESAQEFLADLGQGNAIDGTDQTLFSATNEQKRNSALNSSYLLGNKEFYDLASLHGNTAYSGVSDVFIAALATARDDEWRSSDEMEKLRNHLAALDPSAIEDLAYDIAYGTDNSGGGAVGLIFQPQALLLEALENNPELQDLARDSFAQGSIQQAQDRAQIADITGSILDKLTNGEPLDSDEKWVIAQIAAASLGGPTSMKSLKGSPALKRVAAKLGKPIKDFAKDESGGKKPTVDKTNPNPQNQINVTDVSVADKLDRYLLNPDHPVGGPKANWFEQALGFNRSNMDELGSQIKFDSNTATVTGTTEYGTKYNQVIPITGANGKTIDVTFAWIRNTDGELRLVTGIPTSQ